MEHIWSPIHWLSRKYSNSETIDVPQDVYDEDGDSLSFSLSGTDAAHLLYLGTLSRSMEPRLWIIEIRSR